MRRMAGYSSTGRSYLLTKSRETRQYPPRYQNSPMRDSPLADSSSSRRPWNQDNSRRTPDRDWARGSRCRVISIDRSSSQGRYSPRKGSQYSYKRDDTTPPREKRFSCARGNNLDHMDQLTETRKHLGRRKRIINRSRKAACEVPIEVVRLQNFKVGCFPRGQCQEHHSA